MNDDDPDAANASRNESTRISGWAVVDALNGDLAVLDHRGIIVATNAAWKRASTAPRRTIATGTGAGTDYLQVWNAWPDRDAAQLAIAGIRAVLSADTPIFTLEVATGLPGDEEWFLLSVSGLDRPADGAVVSHINISKRKRAEAALRESEARMRSLVLHGMEAISIADADGVIHYEAPGIERVLGYAPDELVGRTMPGLHPDDARRLGPIMQELFRDPGGHRTFTMRIRHKQGDYRTLQLTATNMLHDPAVNGMIYNFHDITDRLASEQEVMFQNELLNQAWVGVVALDPDGTIRHWNHHAERIYGWTRDEVLGRPALEVLVGDDDRERVGVIFHMLRHGEGWEGELVCPRKDRSVVDVRINASALLDVYGKVMGIVAIAIDITDRKRMEEQLRHHAVHDALTGLPNRVLLFDRLEQALSRIDRGRHVAVLFIDLDRFKLVNDSFGHATGDAVLQRVATRFTEVLPRNVTLARLSGDEFIVLLDSVRDEDDAVQTAHLLLDALKIPFRAGEQQVSIGASIGITLGTAGRADADTLLRQADSALYRVKATRRGAIIVHDQHASLESTRFLDLKRDLRQALDRHEFVLHFQPIVSLRTGETTEVEALIRWQHPQYGLIAPTEFIPAAEDMGLLTQIGRWVTVEASRRVAKWAREDRREHRPEHPIAVSINLSAHQFADPALVRDLERSLMISGLEPRRLILELTEDALIDDMSTTIATLARLRASGIRVMIDDFGSGYSSLGYLRELPVDGIKLDRAFVRGLGTEAGSIAIVEAIIQMAHALNLRVTAEGIETADQLSHLQRLGCDYGQGFLFARPSEGAPAMQWPLPPASSPLDGDAIAAMRTGGDPVVS